MPLVSAGRTLVAVAGTPVQVTATRTPCQSIIVQALTTNTQKVYIGLSGMNKVTLAGVLAVLTTGQSYSASSPGLQDPLDLAQIFVDVDVNNEGVLTSYFVN